MTESQPRKVYEKVEDGGQKVYVRVFTNENANGNAPLHNGYFRLGGESYRFGLWQDPDGKMSGRLERELPGQTQSEPPKQKPADAPNSRFNQDDIPF